MPDSSNVVARAEAVTSGDKGIKKVSVKIPLPCITILIHGVNDVGEAYDAQEIGICAGLNSRLNRSHSADTPGAPDLVPGAYKMPSENDDTESDPDAVYFRRTPDENTWSPVVPFYWGFREDDKLINRSGYHGQWTDRYGTRLDKNGAKNGGPFANATSTLNDMWGAGFSGKVAHSETAAHMASSPSHNLVTARPRHYMLLGAKRLGMLIKMIRTKYPGTAINVLCHSQGSMVTLAAHALLAVDGGVAADTVIVQDPPYSLEEAVMEGAEVGTDHQQTTQSRINTLYNIVQYINSKKVGSPALGDLCFPSGACGGEGVTGPLWKPGAGANHWIGKGSGQKLDFTERDNRGKFYLYFCPHDLTVSLLNVQGIGWQGVPDQIEAQKTGGNAGSQEKLPAFTRLQGVGFHQRMFTSASIGRKPALMVGEAPGSYQVPHVTGGLNANKSVGYVAAVSDMRTINGEELNPKIAAQLGYGEGSGKDAGKLPNSPIDAAIDISGPGGMQTTTKTMTVPLDSSGKPDLAALANKLPDQNNNSGASPDDKLKVVKVTDFPPNEDGSFDPSTKLVTYTTETPNQARRRWQKQYDDNSDHSSIPANPAHAEGVTAYDVSLGKPLPISDDDTAYLAYLCAVADWRTDWDKLRKSTKDSIKKIIACQAAESTAGAVELTNATFAYHGSGILPPDIAVNDEVKLPMPGMIDRQTIGERARTLGYPMR